MIELLTDPAAWAGLLTLVVLEIVLGIDNLIFIAILAEKLPPHQRDRARVIGLSLALVMRLGLLSVVSWLVTLTQPLFALGPLSFSGRDLILLLGGLFLLFKATSELHERLEGVEHRASANPAYAGFGLVVAQIVVLDAVFSLDAVITAVGMVNDLPVMMAAVVISIGVMLLAARPLTRFVNAHPTVVVLCLSFLLMIGLTLVAEGFGFHLPKGYLYAAIGFSIGIEMLNQLARRNQARQQALRPLRERTAESVLRLLGGGRRLQAMDSQPDSQTALADAPAFAPEERRMVSGVLSLAERSVRSIMTPRADVSWVDLEEAPDAVRERLLGSPHSLLPVCRGSLDAVVGVGRATELLAVLVAQGRIAQEGDHLRTPIHLPEGAGVTHAIDVLRQAKGQLVLVNDEYGTLTGLLTPFDVLEAIAGEFPDEDESPEIEALPDGGWRVAGTADIHQVQRLLETDGLVSEDDSHTSVAGYVLAQLGRMPAVGEAVLHDGWQLQVVAVDGKRILTVQIHPAPAGGESAVPTQA